MFVLSPTCRRIFGLSLVSLSGVVREGIAVPPEVEPDSNVGGVDPLAGEGVEIPV